MPRRRRSYFHPAGRVAPANRCRALLVIDDAPLRAAAWAELVRARQRLEKAAREVHRHEETDTPAFRAWLAQAFPVLVSAARELAQQVEAKIRLVQAVESESFLTGRSPGQIWREWQRNGGHPPPPPPGSEFTREPEPGTAPDETAGEPDIAAAFEAEMKRMFEHEGITDDGPFADGVRDFARQVFGGGSRSVERDTAGARDIYRRLVRHLHPDSGGNWTAARARLWEQVQAAWAARDVDWLARLEAEWEAHADLLGPASAVGRLRAASFEIEAARRDAEKRVRQYRKDAAWRFSLRPVTAQVHARIQEMLRHDEAMLRDRLAGLEAVLSQWERSGRRGRSGRRRSPAGQFEMFY